MFVTGDSPSLHGSYQLAVVCIPSGDSIMVSNAKLRVLQIREMHMRMRMQFTAL